MVRIFLSCILIFTCARSLQSQAVAWNTKLIDDFISSDTLYYSPLQNAELDSALFARFKELPNKTIVIKDYYDLVKEYDKKKHKYLFRAVSFKQYGRSRKDIVEYDDLSLLIERLHNPRKSLPPSGSPVYNRPYGIAYHPIATGHGVTVQECLDALEVMLDLIYEKGTD